MKLFNLVNNVPSYTLMNLGAVVEQGGEFVLLILEKGEN
jgi:hypothetical protein